MSLPEIAQNQISQGYIWELGKFRRRLVYNAASQNILSDLRLQFDIGMDVQPRPVFVYGSLQCADILIGSLQRATVHAAALSFRMTPAVLTNRGLADGLEWRKLSFSPCSALPDYEAALVKRPKTPAQESFNTTPLPHVHNANPAEQSQIRGLMVRGMTYSELDLLDASEPCFERELVWVTVQAKRNEELITYEVLAQAFICKPEFEARLTDRRWDVEEFIARWEALWDTTHSQELMAALQEELANS